MTDLRQLWVLVFMNQWEVTAVSSDRCLHFIALVIWSGFLYGVLGWPKSPFIFFHKIRCIFLFTSNCIDLDILSMSAVSRYRLLVVRGRVLPNIFECMRQPQSIFRIKMAAQKFINSDVVFKCMLIWQRSQYSLTELFWIKLKTTKHY